MQQFLPTLFACLLTGALFAQADTVFMEDFQNVQILDWQEFPDSPDSDDIWINWDEDGIEANNDYGNSRWVTDTEIVLPDSIPPGVDTNLVAGSRSWLAGYDTSGSNWLISPAIPITNDGYVVSWSSAPFQGPRYLDGYSVKILTGNSFYEEADQVDVLHRSAEMTGFIGAASSLSIDSFEFGPGIIHANGFTDSIYFLAPEVDSLGNPTTTSNTGLLEPYSYDLSAYAGQTVFIAWHHDSADDNIITIDDLMLVATDGVTSTVNVDAAEVDFYTYPNPVVNRLNVLYNVAEATQVRLEVYNQAGQLMMQTPQQLESGRQNKTYDLSRLPSGTYHVSLWLGDRRATKTVVRR